MRPPRGRTAAALAVAALFAVWLFATVNSLTDQVNERVTTDEYEAGVDRATAKGAANADGLKTAQAQIDALRRQVRKLGGVPVVQPSDVPELVTVPGQTGPPGPAGVDGIDGKDGQRGPRGRTGDDGTAGEAGAPGEAGPPGEGATGPAGPAGPEGPAGEKGDEGDPGVDGKDGAAGDDGRGITALSCDSLTPTRFTVTYDDGTTQTFTCTAGQPTPQEGP